MIKFHLSAKLTSVTSGSPSVVKNRVLIIIIEFVICWQVSRHVTHLRILTQLL